MQTQPRPHELGPGEKLTNFIKETNLRSILYNTKYLSVVWYYQTNGKSTRRRWRKKKRKKEYKQKQRDLNIYQVNNITMWSGRGGDTLVNCTVSQSCNLQYWQRQGESTQTLYSSYCTLYSLFPTAVWLSYSKITLCVF